MSKSLFTAGATLAPTSLSMVAALSAQEAANRSQEPKEPNEISEAMFFESMKDDVMLEAMSKAAATSMRQGAAAAVVQWIEDGDSEADAFEAMAYGLAGGDDGDELTDEQAEDFNEYLGLMSDFCLQAGASANDVQALVDGDDDASDAVFTSVEKAIGGKSEDELIAEFGVRETLMNEAIKKVVRDGKVVTINTNKRKRKMTAAQKAALKKARLKAHSSSAKAARKKAMKTRHSRGM